MQAMPDIIGQWYGFRVTENLDGFACGVNDDAAIGTAGEMLFKIDSDAGLKDTIEITGKFEYNFLAVHCVSLRRKCLFSLCRSFSRARNSRDLTAGTEIPRICAVSSVEIPSTSRRVKTTRKMGSSSPITCVSISLSSVWANFCSGEGPQSSISRKTGSSVSVSGSSSETWLGRRWRSLISASLTAMRTSQV